MCMHTGEENGITNEAIVLQWLVWSILWDFKVVMGWCTTQCKMLLFCVKTIVKESHNFELAHLKKKRRRNKEKHFGCLWFGIFAMFYHILHVHAIPTYRVYRLCDNTASHTRKYYSHILFTTVPQERAVSKISRDLHKMSCIESLQTAKTTLQPDSKLLHTVGKWTHVFCSMELRAPLNPSCLHTTWAFFSLQGVVRESAQTVPHVPLWHTSTRPALGSVMVSVWTSRTSPSWLVKQLDWAV